VRAGGDVEAAIISIAECHIGGADAVLEALRSAEAGGVGPSGFPSADVI